MDNKNGHLVSFLFFCSLLLLFPSLSIFGSGNNEEQAEVVEDTSGSLGHQIGPYLLKYTIEEELLSFTVTAPTTGWVAIGLNPSRGMKDANFIIGYVKEGETHIRDDYGTGMTSHASDESLGGSNDIQTYSGNEEGGKTTLTFTIPLASGDQYDGSIHIGEKNTLLLAYGKNDSFTGIHAHRTLAEIEFAE
jgi:hypothetical protein